MNKYRLRWAIRDIKDYFRGWYRRIRYHWFTNNKLIAVKKFKRSEYWDMVEIIHETVYQLFENFVQNELGGPGDLSQRILNLHEDINSGRCNYEIEREHLKREIKELNEIERIYFALQSRKRRPDPIDVFPLPEKCYLDKDGNPTDEMIGEKIPDESFGYVRKMNLLTDEAKEILDKSWKLEEKYENEDTQLAIDIIKIRRFLWT